MIGKRIDDKVCEDGFKWERGFKMRTQEEIKQRFLERKDEDFLGFEVDEYLMAMTRENLESLRGNGVSKDVDLSEYEPLWSCDEELVETCRDYMSFAWEKANDCRGISANRSIYHYIAWLWLLGEDEFDDLMNDYEYYGKPQLVRICNYLDLDPKEWDDGVRTNYEL